MPETKKKILATISGSFNRHLSQIQEKISELKQNGIDVLSPTMSVPESRIGGFVKLRTDEGLPREIELKHLESISKSDFLYVVNPDGYIGNSVALEIGYAICNNIPIYSQEKPRDDFFSLFLEPKSVQDLKHTVVSRSDKTPRISKAHTLSELQEYVGYMVKRRGFDDEEFQDVILLLLEEIGELARAARVFRGLKVRKRTITADDIGYELADCLVYILDLANIANLSLDEMLRKKEMMNSKRKWHSKKGMFQ